MIVLTPPAAICFMLWWASCHFLRAVGQDERTAHLRTEKKHCEHKPRTETFWRLPETGMESNANYSVLCHQAINDFRY